MSDKKRLEKIKKMYCDCKERIICFFLFEDKDKGFYYRCPLCAKRKYVKDLKQKKGEKNEKNQR